MIKIKVLPLIFAAFFAISLLFAGMLMIIEAEHNCDGANCSVCLIVSKILNVSKKISFIPAFYLSVLSAFFIYILLSPPQKIRFKPTLINLKVIMND
jgi:hypothetical protein